MINLPRILRDSSLPSCLPSIPSKFPTPMIFYKLGDTIGKTIFNFNKFVAGLDVTLLVNDPTTVPCSCQNSPYCDPYHGHVITGKLGIVENNHSRKLFKKGPKYREHKKIDFLNTKSCILVGLEDCIKNGALGFNIRVVIGYSPKNIDGSDGLKDEVYRNMKKACENRDKTQKIINAGDCNVETSVVYQKSEFDGIKVIKNELCNDNGQRFKSFCRSHRFCIPQSYFEHPLTYRYTWYSCDGKNKRTCLTTYYWKYSLINTFKTVE